MQFLQYFIWKLWNCIPTVDGRSAEVGSVVRAVVLDFSKRERLVDLSIKPELVKQFDKDNSNSQAQKKVKTPFFCTFICSFLSVDWLLWMKFMSTFSTASLVPKLTAIITEEKKRSLQQLRSAPDSNCYCWDRERKLPGKLF